jgi:hypothetical protein
MNVISPRLVEMRMCVDWEAPVNANREKMKIRVPVRIILF